MSCSQTTVSCIALRPHTTAVLLTQTEYRYPFTQLCVKYISSHHLIYFKNSSTSIPVARRQLEGLAIPSTHACYRRLKLAAHVVARPRKKAINVTMQDIFRLCAALRD
jgi:hypothetical protein